MSVASGRIPVAMKSPIVPHPEIPIGYTTTPPEAGRSWAVFTGGLVVLPCRGCDKKTRLAAAILWRMYGPPNKQA